MLRQMRLACVMLAVAGFPATLLAAASTKPAMNEAGQPSFELQLNREALLPYQPLIGVATLHNPTNHAPIRVEGAWNYAPTIQYKVQGDKEWIRIDIWWLPRASIAAPEQTIEPGKSAQYKFALYTFDASTQPIFQSGRKYQIRVGISLRHPNMPFYSDAAVVRCLKVPAEEQAALDALAKNAKTNIWNSLRFDLLPLDLGPSDNHADNLQRIEAFVKAHPQSLYSLYLRRSHILYVKTIPGQHDKTIDAQAAAYRAYLKQHAPWLPL